MTTTSPDAGHEAAGPVAGGRPVVVRPAADPRARRRERRRAPRASAARASARRTPNRPREGWSGGRASMVATTLRRPVPRDHHMYQVGTCREPRHPRRGILRATDGCSTVWIPPFTMGCRAARLAALVGLSSLLIGVIGTTPAAALDPREVDRAIRLRRVGHARRAAGLLRERGRAHARRLSLGRHGGRARPLRWRAVHADRSRGAFPIFGRKSSRC